MPFFGRSAQIVPSLTGIAWSIQYMRSNYRAIPRPPRLGRLGFTQPWRYEEEGKAWVAQVDRQGCELILSSQWPDKVGKGLMFISLDVGVLEALRAELEGRGVDVKDGQWGYRLMVIVDPDGNELYFPYPTGSLPIGSLITSNPQQPR